jgi:dipeptidyl aminopeptidase/acylaminoacyl peptidase
MAKRLTLPSLIAIVALSMSVFAGANPGSARITLEDLAASDGLATPVLSPSGREFAFTADGQIKLLPADGGWPVALTTTGGGKNGLNWSADGKRLAFASQGGIWVVEAAGGPPKRLTNHPPGSGDPRSATDRAPKWSPKGTWILFETGRRGHNDLMLVSDDGTRTNLLADFESDASSASWSPDGQRIAFVERATDYFSGALKVIEIDTVTGMPKSAARELYRAKTDRGGGWQIREPVWSPDGSMLAVVLQDSGWDKIYLIPAAGGSPKPITSGDGEDGSPVFSPDGRTVAFTSNRGVLEERHVWLTSLDGKSPRRLTDLQACTETNPQWSRDGREIYFLKSSPLEPSNLVAAAAAGGAVAPRALTHTLSRNFERAAFPPPEAVHYKSPDGLDISAMLYRPLNYVRGRTYPAVLWIHGGPEGQDGFTWDPWALFLTQEGYVVLEPNYRGSTGYGEKFRNLNVEDSGGGELDDVVAGAKYIVDNGLADRKRLGIGGGSHGGTMVAYAITKQPDLFKVALELYGVVDRATFNERTNRNSAIRWMMKMGGTPEEKPEVYRKAKALADVSKIITPVYVMHGEDDPQVPPFESAQFVEALKKNGKVYRYTTYPKEGHGFSQRDHKLDAWSKQLEFLKKYLQPVYGQSVTSTTDDSGK